jgi:plastocyanin
MTSIQHRRRIVGPIVALALVLAACGSSASSAPSAAAPGGSSAGGAVAIIDFAFQPASISVPKGTTVTWTNTGATAHTVTADDASFDSGNVDVGKTFSTTANTAGSIAYHCTIHPQMKATIVVAP